MVMIGDRCSAPLSLPPGVPQGSILGPVPFLFEMLPPGSIITEHNLSFHFYADDLQIYLPIKPSRRTDVNTLASLLQPEFETLGLTFGAWLLASNAGPRLPLVRRPGYVRAPPQLTTSKSYRRPEHPLCLFLFLFLSIFHVLLFL